LLLVAGASAAIVHWTTTPAALQASRLEAPAHACSGVESEHRDACLRIALLVVPIDRAALPAPGVGVGRHAL
jgi:hypothetical protein